MNIRRVAILGAGNGGITAAADLKNRGFEVSLFELQEFGKTIELLRQSEPLTLKTSEGTSKVELDLLTTDIIEALKGAQVVMLTIPALWTEKFAKICAPIIRDDQIILIHNAACMGSVRFVKTAREMGIATNFQIGELNTLAYGTRAFPDTGEIELSLRVKVLYFAAYPAGKTQELFESIKQLYDSVVPAHNIWEVTLNNGNPEVHPGPCLLNAGRIEYSRGDFWLYKEGITTHTVNILKQVGQERVALGKALGFDMDDGTVARIKRGYLVDGPESLDVKYNTSPVFSKIKGPASVDSRYIVEDISNGLVLYSSLGKAIGVPTPASDAIITLGGFLLQRDFLQEGVTLEMLGMSGLDANGLNEAVS